MPIWTLLPTKTAIHNMAKLPRRDIRELASRCWEVAPAETRVPPPAVFLPGQLDRVTGQEFVSKDFRREMYGGVEVHHAATKAYLLEQALLVNGVVYKDDASMYLLKNQGHLPPISVRGDIPHGALYCTFGGNRYFGQWLIDDCVSYRMAESEGLPVTTARPLSEHAEVYEQWLEMSPCRVTGARFRELLLFDDYGQNRHKSDRYREVTARLQKNVDCSPHPGVFVLRRASGSQRVLQNELELAEQLQVRRGFRVIDPMTTDVPTILATCAGARIVVGVEGSHLVHALLMLSEGRALLTIMPPFRFCTVLKDVADREGIRFGFVVGQPAGKGFVADLDELERTVDLLLAEDRRCAS